MPRLGVTALRWMLLVVNLGALTGALALGKNVILPDANGQLRLALPNPADFVVPPEAEQVFDQGQLRTMLQRHNRKPPPPPRPPAPPVERNLPIVEGGPLESWEIASTTIKDSYRAVQIQERVETSTVTTTRPTRTSSRSRVPANRRRSSGRSASRRPSPAAQSSRVRYVREGDEFTIDDKIYVAVRITVQPEETFEYRDRANQTFTLTREYPELDGVELDDDGRVTSLLGMSDAELGLEVATPGAPSAVPADQMGSIRSGRSASRTPPQRQPATQRQPSSSADKEKAKELEKAVNEAKKSGKLSPSDQKKLDEAGKGLKRNR